MHIARIVGNGVGFAGWNGGRLARGGSAELGAEDVAVMWRG
ncbi:MAG: hypothetical protein OXG53_00590 [Chloroflexi bacterium]|nr:hypothetical protein [Chloroflexota bacterium]